MCITHILFESINPVDPMNRTASARRNATIHDSRGRFRCLEKPGELRCSLFGDLERSLGDADVDRVERFAISSPACVKHTHASPPRLRGHPLDPKRFAEALGLIKVQRSGYSAGQYHQRAGVLAVNKCRGEK